MQLSVEATGKNIEKAIETALIELKAPREDVDIKIISEGGLFKKAKVAVSISKDAIEKYQKREKLRKEDVEKTEEIPVVKEVKQEREQKVEVKVEEKVEVKIEEEKPLKQPKKEKIIEPLDFLQGYFKALGKEVEITTIEDENFITYSVMGDDLGEAIGHRGEAYYALHTLLTAVAGKREKRILIDVDNYKEKREESLAATARNLANKVAKSGRYYKMDPMKPAERRIIHTTLQDDDRVTTLSKGTEPKRYVIIFPKEYKE